MQFGPLAEQYGFLYLYPDGTVDSVGNRFWNATDACCNFFGSGVDDSAYLRALIDEIQVQLNVDTSRIHLVGHSNGGFMSHRMACDHADIVASIASLAGATFSNPDDCAPGDPVHVLQIHGTADAVIFYGGGQIAGNPYPGAVETVEQWATENGCSLVFDDSFPPLDLDASIPGDETTVRRYESECSPGGSSELWSIIGGEHVPVLSADFSTLVIEYLFSHPKPEILFQRGEANGDGLFDLGDAVATLDHLFQGAPVGCQLALDANDDGQVNIGDPVYLLEYLFNMGSPPPAPFPDCGPDPTPGLNLTCTTSSCP
jgi:polyhydroxybutyrate depolymerase